MRWILLTTAALSGCGSLDPVGRVAPYDPPATPDEIQGPQEEGWDFETPPGWDPAGEVWRFELGLPDALGLVLPDELGVEILIEDEPWAQVRTAAIRAGTEQQDWCVPTAVHDHAWSDADGGIAFRLGTDQVDLGQPWTWDALEVRGVRTEIGGLEQAEAVGWAPATALVQLLLGTTGDACGRLGDFGLGCVPCESLDDDCALLELTVVGHRDPVLLIEPISAGDVTANPQCQGL